MRSPIQDANAGATMDVAPTKKHATRTATIARNHSNQAVQKQQEINKLGSTLGSALQGFMDKERATELEQRYQQAYFDAGTKEGTAELTKDMKRTGFMSFIAGGKQSPEYLARLQNSADSAAISMLSEEIEYLEEEGGYLPPKDYRERSQKKTKAYIEENFKDNPDAAFAFMKSWQKGSNQLAKQHAKLHPVRMHEQARAEFKNGFQEKITLHKQLVKSDPNTAPEVLDSAYTYNAGSAMTKPAWQSAVFEESLVLLQKGDTSIIPSFKGSEAYQNADGKQLKAFNTAIKNLDTINTHTVSTAEHKLEADILAGNNVSQAYKAYDDTMLMVSAKDTGTEQHRLTIQKSNTFRGKSGDAFDKLVRARVSEADKIEKERIAFDKAAYDATFNGFGDQDTEAKNQLTLEYMATSLAGAADDTQTLTVRTEHLKNLQVAQDNLEEVEGDKESAYSSKANLISAQFNLAVDIANSQGQAPVIPEEYKRSLEDILDNTTSDDTRTLVTNLLANIESTNTGELEAFTSAQADKEQSALLEIDSDEKIALSNISTDREIDDIERDKQEVAYMTTRIKDLTELVSGEKQQDIMHKQSKDELRKQLLWWKGQLKGKVTEEDIRARAKRKAEQKEALNAATIASIEESYRTGVSRPDGTKEQNDKAADNIVRGFLKVPGSEDMTDTELVDQGLSNWASVQRLAPQVAKLGTTFKSPILKEGVNTVMRKMLLPDAENPQTWSSENAQAVEAMQAIMMSAPLRGMLSPTDQNKAEYLISAMAANISRTDAERDANSPVDTGNKEPTKSLFGWDGIVDELGLDKANDDLQAHARSMYSFLLPRVGHEAAKDSTNRLVKFQDISTGSLDIKFGAAYPDIEFEATNKLGEKEKISTTLEKFAKDFDKFTVTTWVDSATGKTMMDTSSPANMLALELIGNSTTKDGTTIRSLKDIPGGVSVQMVGDALAFVSNYGTAILTKGTMAAMAASVHKGKQNDAEARERLRARQRGNQLQGFYYTDVK